MTQVYKTMIGLNVYLEPQFRKEVIEKVYANIQELSEDIRRDLLQITKEELKVSGFRNPMLAPLALRVRAAIEKFEKESRFTKQILAAWADLYRDVHEPVLSGLKELGFEVLETAGVYPDPEMAFASGWPDGLTYEQLHQALSKIPENKLTSDENALLSIWLTGALP